MVLARWSWLAALCAVNPGCERPVAEEAPAPLPSATADSAAKERLPAVEAATVIAAGDATPAVASGYATQPSLAPLLQGGCHHSLAFEAVGDERWVSEGDSVHRFDHEGHSRGAQDLTGLHDAAGGPTESVSAFGDTAQRPWFVAARREQGVLARALYREATDGSVRAVETLGKYGAVVAFADAAFVYDDITTSMNARIVGDGARGLYPAAELGEAEYSGRAQRVLDVQLMRDGTFVALTSCRDLWLSRWKPGRPDGEHTLLRRDATLGSLALDAAGRGYADVHDDDAGWLFRIDGAAAKAVPRPAQGPSSALSLDERGQPWLAVGRSLFRAAGEDWVAESVPTTGSITALAGVEQGRPWILDDGAPAARLSSGQWVRVPMLGRAYALTVLEEATYVSATGPEETGRRVYRTNHNAPALRCDR